MSEGGSVPAALLLHGYTSRKERMSDTVGSALLPHGVASIAIDLPLHGEREEPVEPMSVGRPFELARRWHAAIDESALAFRYLGARPEIDAVRLALVGYSLGSFLAAAGEPKELRLWDASHYLPPAAIADAAEWLAKRLGGEQVSEEQVSGVGCQVPGAAEKP